LFIYLTGIEGIKRLFRSFESEKFGLGLRLELIPVMPITPKIYHKIIRK
jgi:hypothetical protein